MALAGSGATTLVGLMVSDGWAAVRGRIARLVARGGDVATAERELDSARAGLVAAQEDGDAEATSDYVAEWTPRLRRLFRADPDAGRQLLDALEELSGPRPGTCGNVYNSISGGSYHAPVIQARDLHGGQSIG